MPKRELNPRQALFVEHYVADAGRNAAKAARDAGYAKKNSRQLAAKLMTNPLVIDAIEKRTAVVSATLNIEAERVLQEIAGIAYDTKEKSQDRLRTLELLGKNLALFTDRQVNVDERTEILQIELADRPILKLAQQPETVAG